MFAVDVSSRSTVVVCHGCGWRCMALDKLDGWRRAAAHERQMHEGSLHASTRYSQTRGRHAD